MTPTNPTSTDADKWNARYETSPRPAHITAPDIMLNEFVEVTPRSTVLDVACGWGDAGLHCARLGAEVTLVDVSQVAIEAVEERATSLNLTITTAVIDLSVDPIPTGPWDLITCNHYLHRTLLADLVEALSPGGHLMCAIATTTNLERHDRPSARFLLDAGELPTLVPNANVVHHSEQWRTNGVHEAWLVASRPA